MHLKYPKIVFLAIFLRSKNQLWFSCSRSLEFETWARVRDAMSRVTRHVSAAPGGFWPPGDKYRKTVILKSAAIRHLVAGSGDCSLCSCSADRHWSHGGKEGVRTRKSSDVRLESLAFVHHFNVYVHNILTEFSTQITQ